MLRAIVLVIFACSAQTLADVEDRTIMSETDNADVRFQILIPLSRLLTPFRNY
jgi:hypothetical protein